MGWAFHIGSHRLPGGISGQPGSLVPALQRMEQAGWLTSSWGESQSNRRARDYRLTKAGQRQLKTETEDWERITLAFANALQAS
jgi:PadR family transcriptional regulator PadR